MITLCDLYRCGYKLYQDDEQFCFGMDAVLLAEFAKAYPGERVMDLGTGTGVIPTLMAARYPDTAYEALERNSAMAELAGRSVVLNELTERLTVTEGNIRDVKQNYAAGSFAAVTSNPPYMKAGSGLTNPDDATRMARHETECTLRDVCEAASYLLPYHGRFYMVHRPRRLPEIFEELKRAKLEPKRMRLVHPYPGAEPAEVLIEAVKCGGPELKVMPPLFEYECKNGAYTPELLEIYGNG